MTNKIVIPKIMTLSVPSNTPSVDQLRADLIALVDEYAALSGLADSGISRGAFGTDSGFVKKLRAGESFTISSALRFEQWLREQIAASKAERASEQASSTQPSQE